MVSRKLFEAVAKAAPKKVASQNNVARGFKGLGKAAAMAAGASGILGPKKGAQASKAGALAGGLRGVAKRAASKAGGFGEALRRAAAKAREKAASTTEQQTLQRKLSKGVGRALTRSGRSVFGRKAK